ncbi:MAG: hypothetical protein JNM69_19360 [Archangium sp.]|nr:hypothetical protein [Archangium sp.]
MKVVLVWGWLVVAVGLGGLLTLLHEGPLPLPEARPGGPTPTWTMTHALAMRCPCSRRVVDHLLSRRASAGVVERVLLVDPTPAVEASLTSAGFLVEAVEADSLAGRGFVAVPGLVIRSPSGDVAYAGAHAPKRSGPIDDVSLLTAARDGAQLRPFAVLGCAISQALNARVDPLALKSPSWPGALR